MGVCPPHLCSPSLSPKLGLLKAKLTALLVFDMVSMYVNVIHKITHRPSLPPLPGGKVQENRRQRQENMVCLSTSCEESSFPLPEPELEAFSHRIPNPHLGVGTTEERKGESPRQFSGAIIYF